MLEPSGTRWLLAALAIGASPLLQAGDGYFIDAEVVHVDPIVRYVEVEEPYRVCRDEVVYRRVRAARHRTGDPVATLVGGVIGGLVGNQVGEGRRHRGALTVAGSVLGAAIGHGATSTPRRHRYRDVETVERRCHTRTRYREEAQLDGYEVTYLYQGRRLRTRTDYDPGDRIRVRVRVTPLDDIGYSARINHGRCADGCLDG
jgi:uncharacterized protein YcfJ